MTSPTYDAFIAQALRWRRDAVAYWTRMQWANVGWFTVLCALAVLPDLPVWLRWWEGLGAAATLMLLWYVRRNRDWLQDQITRIERGEDIWQ